MNDTSPDMERIVNERIMALSGEERLLMGASMFETARTMCLASLPQGANDTEQRLLLLRRFYGSDFTPRELSEIENRLRGET